MDSKCYSLKPLLPKFFKSLQIKYLITRKKDERFLKVFLVYFQSNIAVFLMENRYLRSTQLRSGEEPSESIYFSFNFVNGGLNSFYVITLKLSNRQSDT